MDYDGQLLVPGDRLTEGVGPDLVIESSGEPEVFLEALQMVRKGGTIIEVGNWVDLGKKVPLDVMRHIASKNLHIHSVFHCGTNWRPVLNILHQQSNRHDFPSLITHRMGWLQTCTKINPASCGPIAVWNLFRLPTTTGAFVSRSYPSALGSRVSAIDRDDVLPQVSLSLRLMRGTTLITSLLLLMAGILGPQTVWGAEGINPFERVVIDPHPPSNPWFKMLGDIDGDGDRDVVVAGSKGPLVWYANPSWQMTQIAEGGWDGVNGETADIDGDGDTDIVLGGIVWFENPSPHRGPWASHRIARQRAHDIEIADLNGDGRLDVVARDQSAFGKTGNKIYVCLQSEKSQWLRLDIDCPHGEGLKLGDIDADGDTDIVVAGLWHENPGDNSSRWPAHLYAPKWKEGDTKVDLADFNGDGRTDIVLSPAELKGETYRVSWFAAPKNRRSETWTEHVVIPSIECVIHSLGVGDFDGDGNTDIAIAEMHQGQDPDEVTVLFNQQQGQSWLKQVLSTVGSHDIVVADIDGDGDPDIVGANHGGSHPLELWRNDRVLQQPASKPGDTSATADDYFPRPESQGGWRKLDHPERIRQLGMDPEKLAELKQWLLQSDDRDFAAVVIRNGYIVLEVERGNSAKHRFTSRRVGLQSDLRHRAGDRGGVESTGKDAEEDVAG